MPDRWLRFYGAVSVIIYFVIILLSAASVAVTWSYCGSTTHYTLGHRD
jgi:hypothetical protein